MHLYMGFDFCTKFMKVLNDRGVYGTAKVCMLVCYDASFISDVIVHILLQIH